MLSYLTISEATNELRKRGYVIDYNLGRNGIQSSESNVSLAPDEFEITEVYRFEGETDPADEAVVYAIERRDGRKGILVNGYGISADPLSDEMVRKLAIRH